MYSWQLSSKKVGSLIAHAEGLFPLYKADKNGVSQLSSLKAASKMVHVPELDYPEPDEETLYILDHFYRLRESCKGKISFLELQAFSQMLHLDLCGWECDIIMQLDSILEGALSG